MDITIQRETLLKPLQAMSSVVEKKQTLPILSNVLLTIKNNHLLLTGTDLEIELIGSIQLKNESPQGSTTVSARKLFDICRTLPDEVMLRLSLEKNYLNIRAGDSHFKLNTLAAQDFPNLEDLNENADATQFTLKQSHLKSLLTKTYFAMGQQDVRHFLNGTFLEISPNIIKCVAADGHRLAFASITDEAIGDVQAQVILPRKSVLELIRLLDNDDANEVSIKIGDGRFRMTAPDYIFTSKLINAQYPDYNRLIRKGTIIAVGDKEAIKQALTRASILSNEKFRGIRFQLEPNKLKITANNSDQEHAEEAVSLEYTGNSLEVGFNVAYLLDAISAIPAKNIRCTLTGPNEGMLIESAENEQQVCFYVVMPMRL